MDQSTYYPSFRIFLYNISESASVYSDGTPTEEGLISYSIVTPIICGFGIIGNALTLVVLSRRELKGSIYVYLAVLAFTDLCSSVLLFISGLSCGVFFMDSTWPVYDVLFGLPLATMFNTMGILTTVMVTFDRICYLSHPLRRRKPKFCHVYLARRTMVVCLFLSVLTTLPYCFIFSTTETGELLPRSFYYSEFYNTYNWIRFIILGVLPSVYLILGNGYLIYALHKVKKIYAKCNKSIKCRKPQNYTNLTVTLILIVFVFVISQIPSMLVSRVAATTFFFTSAASAGCTNTKFLETVREASTVINAISLSSDFVLYYLFCPGFCKVMEKLFTRKKKCKPVHMNVFVVDKQLCLNKKSIKELAGGKLFHMVDSESNRDSLPSSIFDGSCDRSEELPVKGNRDTLITLCSKNID